MIKLRSVNWKAVAIYSIVIVVGIVSILRAFNANKVGNQKTCATVKLKLNGVLTEYMGRNDALLIRVNNLKSPLRATIYELKYKKGFEDGYSLKEGDSVIKEAGSKLITYKRGDSVAVFILDCDE